MPARGPVLLVIAAWCPPEGFGPASPKPSPGWREGGCRLAWDDERGGDVGVEAMANLGLRCLSRGCGVCGLRDLLAGAARGSR